MGQTYPCLVDDQPNCIHGRYLQTPLSFCQTPRATPKCEQHAANDGREFQFRPARLKLFCPHVNISFKASYDLVRKIGQGASADVWEAVRHVPMLHGSAAATNRSRQFVAVKIFDSESKKGLETFKTQREFFDIEWAMLAQLEHPHIVRMFESFIDLDSSFLYLVMELCSGGELIEYVKKETRRRGSPGLEEKDARNLFRQMLYAVVYLHGHAIVHRDIKLENFLFVSSSHAVLKLCDFGTAVILTKSAPRALGRIGTLSYTAPEVCENRGATLLADAWSLGVVLYVLLVGAKPFKARADESKADTLDRISNGAFDTTRRGWTEKSDGSRQLVKSLIVVDENRRFSTFEALCDSWCSMELPTIATLTRDAPDTWRILDNPVGQMDTLQRFVLHLCSQLLSEADLVQSNVWHAWYHMFFALDINKDGRLDIKDLEQGLDLHEPMRQKILDVLHVVDLNCSGSIDWSEWAALALVSSGGIALSDEVLLNAVRLLCNSSHSGTNRFDNNDVQPILVTDQAFAEVSNGGKFLSPRMGSPPPLSRLNQLYDLFGDWVLVHSINSIEEANTIFSDGSMSIEDVREVLESTSWFQVDGRSWPKAGSQSEPFISELSNGMSSPRKGSSDSLNLAATPMASPRERETTETYAKSVLSGPHALSTKLVTLANNHSNSTPNSPRSAHSDDNGCVTAVRKDAIGHPTNNNIPHQRSGQL